MSKLAAVAENVQNIAEAIAAVLQMDVTIVDADLLRVAGTGCFKNSHTVPRNSVFEQSLQSGKSFVVTEPGLDRACGHCAKREECREKAEVCCPIISGGQAVGVIGLVTFADDRRTALIAEKDSYLNFLEKMAGLVASKISEAETMSRLLDTKKKLELTVDMVELGLISIDASGRVVLHNRQAEQLLQSRGDLNSLGSFDYVFPEFAIEEVFRSARGYQGRRLSFFRGRKHFDLIATAAPVINAGSCSGVLLSIQDRVNLKRSMHKVFQDSQEYTFAHLAGRDPCFMEVLEQARKAASADATILITGESGTGKELVARAIHEESRRRNNLFVTVNCAAIPEALLESELFGHEEGAFTGSRKGGKVGLLELAMGGTVFLDEVGDMPLYLQAKLLRVLQDKRIYRVGGTEVVDLNIRIVTATNKELAGLIREGRFREDLYYRLNVIPLRLPPLRERKDDILLLAESFLSRYNQLTGKHVAGFDPAVCRLFQAYPWPGNVRELENVIEYAVNLEKGPSISLETVYLRLKALEGEGWSGEEASLKDRLKSHEQEIFAAKVREHGTTPEGKRSIARELKISRATLYRKLAEL